MIVVSDLQFVNKLKKTTKIGLRTDGYDVSRKTGIHTTTVLIYNADITDIIKVTHRLLLELKRVVRPLCRHHLLIVATYELRT